MFRIGVFQRARSVRKVWRPALLLGAAFLVQGCAQHQWKMNELSQQVGQTSPDVLLRQLEMTKVPDRDRVQLLLNRGMLHALNGDLEAAREDWDEAKRGFEALRAASVSENVGAGTVNETLRAYDGTPGEQVILQALLALSYLASGNLDGARVEMLQADTLVRALQDEDEMNGQLAITRYVSGLVYELGGEWDNAYIAYDKAHNIMQARDQSPPSALKLSLIRTAEQSGRRDAAGRWREKFGEPPALDSGQGELVVVAMQGTVSARTQVAASVYAPGLEQYVSLALPSYPPKPMGYERRTLQLHGPVRRDVQTGLIEDVEAVAREDLEAEKGKLTAAALARMVAKHRAVEEAKKNSPLAGLVANIAGMVSEVADVRSWNTLPSNIQVSRTALPAGTYHYLMSRQIQRIGDSSRSGEVNIEAGRTTVLWLQQAATRAYAYPPLALPAQEEESDVEDTESEMESPAE
ncbi:MAG: COG3014 family protein [Pseudomonadota bacterium]